MGGESLDYVVHINDGKREIQPIVLRLLPGEETGFNLKVINHGEPSNVSLEASDPLMKAVILKRHDSYVASEESVPIKIRMPKRSKRVEGDIMLTSSEGSISIPISLMDDSEDHGDDFYSANVEGNGDDNGFDENSSDDIEEIIDDSEEENGDAESWKAEEDSIKDGVEDIKFSREDDLERYRAASRSRSMPGAGNSGFEDSAYKEHPGELSYDQKYPDNENEKGLDPSHYDQRQDQLHEGTFDDEGIKADDDDAPGGKESLADRFFSFNWEKGSMLIVPAAILIFIILVLLLTFYIESIPMFAGALASSIMIVTLIIYGAATLLKA